MGEVPSGASDYYDKLCASNYEGIDPEASKYHKIGHVPGLLIPLDDLILGARGSVVNVSN
jgi:hypothetical protein